MVWRFCNTRKVREQGSREFKELQNEVFNFQPEGQLDLFSENGGKQIKVKHIGDTPKAGGTLINKK